MFYSTQKLNGVTFSKTDKIKETLPIYIGNDVFIGMNVTVLDGVTIGDGAVVGAGSIVSKDIPPYAIAFGNPIRIHRYRFDDHIIKDLLQIKWWDWDTDKLKDVEESFFDIESFIAKAKKDL
ncbi:MAG: CatB-related O-acetyltransferase [Dysgonomonas sp.]|nr:CatB-related O-acetyltransferase [Dysgonomonas sp.]